LREPGGGLGRTHGDELLADVDMLVVFAGERAGGEDRVGEADDEDAEGGWRDRERVGQRRRRRCQLGQPRRDVTDYRDPVGHEVEPPRGDDRPDDDQQRPRHSRRQEAKRQQDPERNRPDHQGGALDVAELADDLHELWERVRGVDVESEQLRELADHEHDGDAVDVADQDRSGQVVGDSAEPREPGD
jgi:hypothetical protein